MKQDKIRRLEYYDKGLSIIVPILGGSTVLIFTLIEFLFKENISLSVEVSVLVFLFTLMIIGGMIRLKALKLKRTNFM